MTYTARTGTTAVVIDATGEIIGPESGARLGGLSSMAYGGNTPTPAPAPPAPVAICLLWQLQAVCSAPPAGLGFTPPIIDQKADP